MKSKNITELRGAPWRTPTWMTRFQEYTFKLKPRGRFFKNKIHIIQKALIETPSSHETKDSRIENLIKVKTLWKAAFKSPKLDFRQLNISLTL